MKNLYTLLSILLVATLLSGCGALQVNPNAKSIAPSSNIISETRKVGTFTGVDISSIGTFTIIQGEKEALVVTASDNLLPLVKTNVRDGVLFIEMDEMNIQSLKKDNLLSFEITVTDLDSLNVSGLGTVEMTSLETTSLEVVMSGAGTVSLDEVNARDIEVKVSRLGNVILAGEADQANMDISGAGEVNADGLKCKSVYITVPGLGHATLWVTRQLTGTISGSGSVQYFGEPKTDLTVSGLGTFESLGVK
jgi:hypothetical protein